MKRYASSAVRTIIPLLSLLVFPAAAQNVNDPEYIADEIVAIVGNSQILYSDLERVTQEVTRMRLVQGLPDTRPVRDEALETLILQKFMAENARRDSLGTDLHKSLEAPVENLLQDMIREAGSVKALEKKHHKEIYSIKEDMMKEYVDMQLVSEMQMEVTRKVKINYPEVAEFFNQIFKDTLELIPEQYIYAQIVRLPPATEERIFNVKQDLLNYRQRILDGENMAAMARLYSMDPGTARNGGEMGPISRNEIIFPIVDALDNLQPGKISEIIETEYGFHIVMLIAKTDKTVHFRQILRKPEFTEVEKEQEKKLLDSIALAVGTSREEFEKAVEWYSMDKETYMNGGVVFNARAAKMTGDTKYATTRYFRDDIPPTDYRPLSQLKVGEVSKAFEAMDNNGYTIYKIVRLNEVIPTHHADLQEDYEIISEFALVDKQNKALEQWVDDNISNMYIWVSPEYRNARLDRNWIKE